MWRGVGARPRYRCGSRPCGEPVDAKLARPTKKPRLAPGLFLCGPAVHPGSDRYAKGWRLHGDAVLDLGRLAQHVAAAPDGLDVVLALARIGELLPELADEDVDDLELGLVHAAIEVVKEHLLGERGALAQRQELQHLVLLAGQMNALPADLDGLGVEVDDQVAGGDDRLRVPFRAPHDGMDA